MTLSTPLRGGLVGCGFVSRFHLEGWSTIPDARIVALCDLDEERLQSAGAAAPGAAKYRDVAAMLDRESLDFVEICTRPESHRALVEIAARRGVHVLSQKPAALERADLVAMIETCAAAGVRLMIHENWRFRPWYRALRRHEAQAGTIGRPIRLRIVHRETRALRPGGFGGQPYFTTMPRLILLEMGCHLVDAARYVMGEVETVAATIARFGAGHPGDDLATLSLGFAGGSLGLLDMSWCASADLARPEWALNETALEGTEGMLKLQRDGSLLALGLEGELKAAVPLKPDDQVYADGYATTEAHFVEGLVRGTPHETSGADNLRTMDVVWQGYRSAEERKTITLPASP